LGSRRFKTDDRDCAALTNLARQGQGRRVPDQAPDALAPQSGTAAPHRRAQGPLQRLHDQLHALCPGLAAPTGTALKIDSGIGQTVLDRAAAFAGRSPSPRSLRTRARGRVLACEAEF
jgi:hypothetical protein